MDILGRRAGAIPPRLGHVQVTGSVGRRGLVFDRGNPRRLAGSFVLPEAEQPLFEPGADRRVIAWRVEELPGRRLGVRPLVIFEHGRE